MQMIWMSLGDINGYIDRDIAELDGVFARYGVGQRKFEGRLLLEFCLEEICVLDTRSK